MDGYFDLSEDERSVLERQTNISQAELKDFPLAGILQISRALKIHMKSLCTQDGDRCQQTRSALIDSVNKIRAILLFVEGRYLVELVPPLVFLDSREHDTYVIRALTKALSLEPLTDGQAKDNVTYFFSFSLSLQDSNKLSVRSTKIVFARTDDATKHASPAIEFSV